MLCLMKTTVEIPEKLFREAKSAAAKRGVSFRQFLTDAIDDRLNREEKTARQTPWMSHFGSLKLSKEDIGTFHKIIEQEFEVVDLKDWE